MNPWVVCRRPRPGHDVRLFCLSYAGGGASLFRTWADDLPANIEVCAIQLPGREGRLFERPIASMAPLVDALVSTLDPLLDGPFALFGHSMGALVSFELAHALRQQAGLSPMHLMVSGHAAPHLRATPALDYRLPRNEMVGALRRLDGTPPEVLDNAELMDLMLPAIRGDFAVCGTYAYQHEAPLQSPITAFGGRADPLVSVADLGAWRTQTTGPFALRMFPGGHFFVREQQTAVVGAIEQALSEARVLAAAA